MALARAGTTLVLLVAVVAAPRAAHGQACCASAGLIAPTRLRSYEDFAVGIGGRGRSVFGAFDAGGRYAGAGAGEAEWDLEQDLFGAARVLGRGQLAVLVPFIETRRTLSGIAASGGGVGDVAVSGRYDFVAAGEHRVLPGLAVLVGLLAPTGRPPEQASDPWAAGATGKGSWEATVGGAVEQAFEPYFVTLNGLVTWRGSRDVTGVKESFAPRLTGILAAGRIFPHLTTVGLYLTGMRQGDNHDAGGAVIAGSGSASVTGGIAATVSPSDDWRVQTTVFADLPAWGRNQTAGAGATVALLRLWP